MAASFVIGSVVDVIVISVRRRRVGSTSIASFFSVRAVAVVGLGPGWSSSTLSFIAFPCHCHHSSAHYRPVLLIRPLSSKRGFSFCQVFFVAQPRPRAQRLSMSWSKGKGVTTRYHHRPRYTPEFHALFGGCTGLSCPHCVLELPHDVPLAVIQYQILDIVRSHASKPGDPCFVLKN